MMPLKFRKATFADLQAILQLMADDQLGQMREKPADPNLYKKAFDRIITDPNQFLMVVEQEKKVIGTCHLTLIPSLTFQGAFRMNGIDSSWRGQGIGEWMFHKIFELAKAEECQIIQLTTNKERVDALRFYEKLGFKASHEGMKCLLKI